MDLLKLRRELNNGKNIFDLNLKVVYYARVSSDKREQLNSLENQVDYFEEFIKNNPNWEYAGGYIDEGISGTSVDKRENFLRMIDDAGLGKFDLIITKEISRFSRNTLDSIKYTQKLLDYGVGVFFQSDNINTLYSDSELRLTIMASIAQDETRRLSERVKFGMKRAYENGRVLGQKNIYGYNKKDGKLIIKEDEAKFVQELFELYADGKYGFRTIVNLLNEKGYKNQDGKELNPGTIGHIIRNPKYKGYYHGRITESNDYRRKKNIKLDEDDRYLYKDEAVPAIVSEELWDRANNILLKRSKKFHNKGNATQSRYPYSGKIICEEHNQYHYRKLWKDRKIPQESYSCKLYLAKGRAACKTPHIYTRDIDAILEYIGNDLLSNKQKYINSIEELLELYKKAEGGNANIILEISKINKEIARQTDKQTKILELYVDGDMDRASYLQLNNQLKLKTESLEKKLKELKKEAEQSSNMTTSINQARAIFKEISESNIPSLEIARKMLSSIKVLKNSTQEHIKLEINMKYGEMLPATIVKPFILYGETEISPIVGSEQESLDLVDYFNREMEESPEKIWELNMFGKSMHSMVKDGLQNKLYRMPEDAQGKLQSTLEKIINEGKGGLICILL